MFLSISIDAVLWEILLVQNESRALKILNTIVFFEIRRLNFKPVSDGEYT